jgi:translation initiation factor 3 subunit L
MADRDDDSRSGDSADELPARQIQIPDAVDHFLGKLKDSLETRNIPEINKLYEEDFNKLSEKHYKPPSHGGRSKPTDGRWPEVEAVRDQVSDHPLFLILYQELYYRHVYSKVQPTFEDRKGSWENYCKLLELLVSDLEDGDELTVALPNQWIWDILDEFVYHYQTYCNFRNKSFNVEAKNAKSSTRESDLLHIKANPSVFETPKVLCYLQQLISASKIEDYLKDPQKEDATGLVYKDQSARMFGYFGLMQMLRLHILLADYHSAMQTIDCIDFDQEVPLFYKIPACHVSLHYYMGFAYLMLRRYKDAIRTFADVIVWLSKTSGVNQSSYQYDQMRKKEEQMYSLLLICTALCPQPLDESINKEIRDRFPEKHARLQRGEETCFEEQFIYACPKFVSAALPENDDGTFKYNEAHQRQLHLFLQDVRQQHLLPRISSYMKLYTSLQTAKLAQLCDMDEEGLRDQLMCVMNKTRQQVRQKGRPLDGERELCSEVEFYLDGDMVHINAQKTELAHSDIFIEQIQKFQDLIQKMQKP